MRFLNEYKFAIITITIGSKSLPTVLAYATFYQDSRGWYFMNLTFDPEIMDGELLQKIPKEQSDDQEL